MRNKTILLSGVLLLVMIASVALGASPRGLTNAMAASNPPAGLPPVPGAPQPFVAESSAAAATPQAAALVGPMRLTNPALHPGAFYIDYWWTSDTTFVDPKTYPVQGAFAHLKWYELQTGPTTFNWTYLHKWINARVGQGLNAGIMIDPYDGKYDGDSRAIPDFVISTPGTMVVVPDSTPEQNRFVNYFDKVWNGGFDCPNSRCPGSPLGNNWTFTGSAGITSAVPAGGDGYAARLAPTNTVTPTVTSWNMRIPAMPPELTTNKMRLSFSVAMTTTDTVSDTDHLYVEIIDVSHGNAVTRLGDITNTSIVSNTWQWEGPIDVSSFVGREVQIRFVATTNSATPSVFYVDSVTLQVRMLIPKYWGTPYKDAYGAFVQALGKEFKNDPGLDFVAMGMGLSGETQPANSDLYNSVLSGPPNNLTSGMWIETVNKFTDYYIAAFSDGSTLLKSLLIQYAPTYLASSETLAVTGYAAQRGAGLSHNGLLPDWTSAVNDPGTFVYNPMISWNKYVPIAFESYPFYLCSPVATYWALFNALDKHTDYMRIDKDLLTGPNGPANKLFFDWAKNYWGRTPENTPSVWTVMREHRNPMEMCHAPTAPNYATGNSSSYPQMGNYNFWLTQDDLIAHGRTVLETNDPGVDKNYAKNPVSPFQSWPDAGLGNCPTTNRIASRYSSIYLPDQYPCNKTPYNPSLPALAGANPANPYDPKPLTGGGKEAWVIRRTDQKTGNFLMGLNIDSLYMGSIPGQVYSATITVTYLDMYTDTWSLRYDSTSGVKMALAAGSSDGYVHKGGTKKALQAKFVVQDARFRSPTGESDFYIDSRGPGDANDGDEWIHMVDVAKGSAQAEPTPTPTATATATQTETPTVTPTATPSTGAVVGTAFADLNRDTMRDPGEPGLAGAVLELRAYPSGSTIYTTTSGLDGSYRLDGVSPAQYRLVELTPPPGYQKWPDSGMSFVVSANTSQTWDLPHAAASTATPTATPTETPTATPTPTATRTASATPHRSYLPLLLRQ